MLTFALLLHAQGKYVRDFACSGPLDKLADNMQWAPLLANSKVPDKSSVVCMMHNIKVLNVKILRKVNARSPETPNVYRP